MVCLFLLVLKKDVTCVEFDTRTQTTIYWTYKWEKLNKLNIKNRTYYFYNDQIILKDFDARLLKIGKKDYKKIDIYYIGYVAVKKKKKMLIATILTVQILCT